MEDLKQKTYLLWFNWVGNKVIEWRELKPGNTDIKNCVKGLNEIGTYVNGLMVEVDVLRRRISSVREEKNKIILSQKETIKELKKELKKYEING